LEHENHATAVAVLLDAAGHHRGIAAKLRLKASVPTSRADGLSAQADECQRAAAMLRTR
jgi:hypothetical protein